MIVPFFSTILLLENIMSEQYIYETHNIKPPLLPFIFHPLLTRSGPARRINWHENIEILFCTNGDGFVQCGPEQISFSKGDLFIVNADTLHSIGSISSVSYQCLIIDRSFFLENGIPIDRFCFQNRIQDTQMAQFFANIAADYAMYDPGAELSTANIRFAVLSFILRLCQKYASAKSASITPTDSRVKMAIIYIRNHLRQSISLDDLSAHTGLSKYHLSRQFKAATGETIIEFLNLTRCMEAKRLIENGASVSSAALSCGFDNLSYFSRTYKKYLGELPSSVVRK